MRNGRFHPSKCRGKVQKMGVLYIHSPKMPSPSPNFFKESKFIFIKPKKLEKGEVAVASPQFFKLRVAVSRRPVVACRPCTGALN
jgi:hypothetical protein